MLALCLGIPVPRQKNSGSFGWGYHIKLVSIALLYSYTTIVQRPSHNLFSAFQVGWDREDRGMAEIAETADMKLSLSELHFNTGRLLFQFNGLQYRFAARQVLVAFANPVSVSFG